MNGVESFIFLKNQFTIEISKNPEEIVNAFAKISNNRPCFVPYYTAIKKKIGKPPIYYADELSAREIILNSIVFCVSDAFQESIFCENQKENISKFIDSFISTSIMYERHEMTAILIDWKYKNNLHTEKNWEL